LTNRISTDRTAKTNKADKGDVQPVEPSSEAVELKTINNAELEPQVVPEINRGISEGSLAGHFVSVAPVRFSSRSPNHKTSQGVWLEDL
jgi:hypothetical protein